MILTFVLPGCLTGNILTMLEKDYNNMMRNYIETETLKLNI